MESWADDGGACTPSDSAGLLATSQHPSRKSSFHGIERFKQEVVSSICFDRLRDKYGSSFGSFFDSHVVPIGGDLSKPGLGISPEDTQILVNSLNVIVNCAASVDFVVSVEEALTTNVYGSLRMMELAQKCPKPPHFVHISTAFVSSNNTYEMVFFAFFYEFFGSFFFNCTN